MVNPEWPGKLTRRDAIKLLDKITDHDDPYWDQIVEDFYHEETDTMPSIFHLYVALGVTKKEFLEVNPGANIDDVWPNT